MKRASRVNGEVRVEKKDYPATYLFKTARNKCGILQVLGVTEDLRSHNKLGMKFRYKMLQNYDEKSSKTSDTLNSRSGKTGAQAGPVKVTERKWSDATIDFTLRIIEPTAKTPFVAEIVIGNRTDEMQSVPTPSIMPLCGDTNKNNIRVFDKDNKPLKMHGIHAGHKQSRGNHYA